MSTTSGFASFANLRRPLLVQRFVLTVVVSLLVVVLPLGPDRFALAGVIVAVQFLATWLIERRPRELIDQLGGYLLVEQLLVLAAGVICPPSYVAACMLGIASVAINAPYLTLGWLRRVVPVTVLGTVAAPLLHDIDGALPIICISTLLCVHMAVNRGGAVLLAARAAERAQHEAEHDPLTGLANRRVLVERLGRLEPESAMGVLLVDLDGFKEVNDNFGHEVGDTVLREVADRLSACDDAVVAVRFGGDEFALMVPGAADETERVADLVLATFTSPFSANDGEVMISASIGMSHSTSAAPDELLRHADLAMFQVKRAGGGRGWYSGRVDTEPSESLVQS